MCVWVGLMVWHGVNVLLGGFERVFVSRMCVWLCMHVNGLV